MLKSKRHIVIFTILLLGLAVLGLAANDPAPAGTVIDLSGQALAKNGDTAPRTLAKGGPVFPKDVVTTKTDADKVRIKFADDSTLDVGPSSVVSLAAFSFDPADQTKSSQDIRMAKGIFRYVTGKVVAQNPDNLKIESPLSVIGIRGTTTDHWIKAKEKTQGQNTVYEVESELHALRDTKTSTQVIIQTETERLTLTKPGEVAWVRPNLPGSVRPLTDEEMQNFGRTPFERQPFDPAPRRGMTGGGGL
jgi:hypothetical protein